MLCAVCTLFQTALSSKGGYNIPSLKGLPKFLTAFVVFFVLAILTPFTGTSVVAFNRDKFERQDQHDTYRRELKLC